MKRKSDVATYIFWIMIIFFMDPGGFIVENLSYVGQSLISFALTGIAFLAFGFKYHKNELIIVDLSFVKNYLIILIIWYLYYFIWYYGINNNTYPGFLRSFAQNPRVINRGILVLPIAYFGSINFTQFVKVFSWTTIFILTGFIVSVITKISIVPYWLADRAGTTRYLMYGYGFFHLVIPMTLSLIFMKYPRDKRLISGFILVVILTLLSIMRRDMIGIIESIVIISFFTNYIHRRKPFRFLSRFINMKNISVAAILILALIYFSPKFVKTSEEIIGSTYNSIVLGQSESGGKDVRMSITAQAGIVGAILDNFWGGTGFNKDWFHGDGGKRGWEGADYIFLATFAMYGLVGLLLFLPFYFLVFRLIFRFLRILRENLDLIYEYKNIFVFPVIVGMAAAAEFVKNVLEYPNWFFPIGALPSSSKYFIYFGLLLGSYYFLQKKIYLIKVEENED